MQVQDQCAIFAGLELGNHTYSHPGDLAGLSEFLQEIKAKYPGLTDATLLLEHDIPYDSLVQVMDTMRLVEQHQNKQLVQAELFPSVSVGDAPVPVGAAGGAP